MIHQQFAERLVTVFAETSKGFYGDLTAEQLEVTRGAVEQLLEEFSARGWEFTEEHATWFAYACAGEQAVAETLETVAIDFFISTLDTVVMRSNSDISSDACEHGTPPTETCLECGE